ncbi:hypothetical protein BO71DRAFT_403086 [Aspergillus ellipticus CBS 707.79]|uniref:Uncharacterized protein n=1 Tax=Aspergillus ellipticus CBS 707.79 TaxID=1448320 RepID=A0A319EEC9_9EURO|nr:hypothetical protein BO71DRAFT_403086 [Aspergillus ellipticus CBS 707.79]
MTEQWTLATRHSRLMAVLLHPLGYTGTRTTPPAPAGTKPDQLKKWSPAVAHASSPTRTMRWNSPRGGNGGINSVQ